MSRGHDRERLVRDLLESGGGPYAGPWWVSRAAGSLGDADLVALQRSRAAVVVPEGKVAIVLNLEMADDLAADLAQYSHYTEAVDALSAALSDHDARYERNSHALLVEVKSTTRSPFAGFPPADRRELSVAAELAGAEAWLCWTPPTKVRGKASGIHGCWIPESEWPAS